MLSASTRARSSSARIDALLDLVESRLIKWRPNVAERPA
jgi:hypothetical protein